MRSVTGRPLKIFNGRPVTKPPKTLILRPKAPRERYLMNPGFINPIPLELSEATKNLISGDRANGEIFTVRPVTKNHDFSKPEIWKPRLVPLMKISPYPPETWSFRKFLASKNSNLVTARPLKISPSERSPKPQKWPFFSQWSGG